MFSKKKDMNGVIASFTAEAKAIAAAQATLVAKKREEIAAAQVELDAAVTEIKIADAFIANVEAMAKPAVE